MPAKPHFDLPSDLSAPAYRALTDVNVSTLKQLSKYTEDDIRALHGIGPNAIMKLKRALREKDLDFNG
jgi:hypothetical protein